MYLYLSILLEMFLNLFYASFPCSSSLVSYLRPWDSCFVIYLLASYFRQKQKDCERKQQNRDKNKTWLCVCASLREITKHARLEKENFRSCMHVCCLLYYDINKAIKSAKVCMCANQMFSMLPLQFHFSTATLTH